MPFNKKTHSTIAIGTLLRASLFAILSIFNHTVSAQDAKIEIKIGHAAPLSGPISHLGKDNENGAKMAIEELNSKGIFIAGKKVIFKLVTEDDAADPGRSTIVAQKLVEAKVKGVVGHLNSGTSIPASKFYNDAGIPQISPSSTAPRYTQQGYKTAFRVLANDAQLGNTLGQYAVLINKSKKIAVIDDRTTYGQGVAEEFIKGVKNNSPHAEIVSHQSTNDKATEFGTILSNIKSQNPDLIFFGGMDAVAGPLLRQMKQLGINTMLMGGDAICSSALPALAGNSIADGQVVCAEASGLEDAMKTFKARYKARFGTDVQIWAPNAYDAVMTLADAMIQAKSAEPEKYLPVLARIRHKGITGMIEFDNKGDLKSGILTLYTYQGGKRVPRLRNE